MTTPPPPPGDDYAPQNEVLFYPQSDDDKTMGVIAHGGSVLAGFLVPIIIMLAKKESPFLQQEAKEVLNFSILMLILAIPTCGLSALIAIIFYIMGAISVNNGQPYRYPFNWRIIK